MKILKLIFGFLVYLLKQLFWLVYWIIRIVLEGLLDGAIEATREKKNPPYDRFKPRPNGQGLILGTEDMEDDLRSMRRPD